MAKVVTHPIKDNLLLINNKEYFGLDVSKVITGVEVPDKKEIVKNPETGLNYARNAVEGQEVYNLAAQHHHPWFILDLETGSRGWYPGCEIHGDITGTATIREQPEDGAAVIEVVSGVTVKVLDIDAIDEEPFKPGWHKIQHNVVGYVKQAAVSNLRYENPF